MVRTRIYDARMHKLYYNFMVDSKIHEKGIVANLIASKLDINLNIVIL